VADCAKSTELELDRQTLDGYRSREDAQVAGQDHVRALVAARSRSLCRGTCESKSSRCKAVVLDDDVAATVRTFMHFDDDHDPSVGWLVEGAITVHCVCVEIRRPNKPSPPAPSIEPAKVAARQRPRKATAVRKASQRRQESSGTR
jgi:hypothetical protein